MPPYQCFARPLCNSTSLTTHTTRALATWRKPQTSRALRSLSTVFLASLRRLTRATLTTQMTLIRPSCLPLVPTQVPYVNEFNWAFMAFLLLILQIKPAPTNSCVFASIDPHRVRPCIRARTCSSSGAAQVPRTSTEQPNNPDISLCLLIPRDSPLVHIISPLTFFLISLPEFQHFY